MQTMIREIANSNVPPLKRPRFTCDNCIADHDISPLPNQSFFLVIVGPAGSGKTSTATSLLTTKGVYYKAFEQVLIVMPRNSLSSLEERHPFHKLEESHIFPDLEHIDTIYQMIDSTSSAINDRTGTRERTLLFIYDMVSQLKDGRIRRRLLEIVNNRRHLRCSILLVTQYLNSIPLAVRRNISHLIAYKPHS
jgi:GTPase SAR1 family protein